MLDLLRNCTSIDEYCLMFDPNSDPYLFGYANEIAYIKNTTKPDNYTYALRVVKSLYEFKPLEFKEYFEELDQMDYGKFIALGFKDQCERDLELEEPLSAVEFYDLGYYDHAIKLLGPPLSYEDFSYKMDYFLNMIKKLFVNFKNYPVPSLLFSKLLVYIRDFDDTTYEVLAWKVLYVVKPTSLPYDTTRNLDVVEEVLKKVIKNANFLKAFNTINKNYGKEYSLKETESELLELLGCLEGKLYALKVLCF
jgi:hypothetical protein